MLFEELSGVQRDDERTFVEALKGAGWNLHANAELIRAGFSVTPEGHATLETAEARIGVELFLESRSLRLTILSTVSDEIIRLRVKFGDNLGGVMQWLTQYQTRLNSTGYVEFVAQLIDLSEEVLFVDAEENTYLLSNDEL